MNRSDRRRQSKLDEKLIARGIDATEEDQPQIAAMARELFLLFERARRERNVDPPVRYLHTKVDATLAAVRDIPIACKKGCAHCCQIWVSVSAPEALFIAKGLKRQTNSERIARLASTHQETRALDFQTRGRHAISCPMLEAELCSIYDLRPNACRFGASGDAAICERTFRYLSDDDIPTPYTHVNGRSAYAVALAMALKYAGLPYRSYELNAALTRALERGDAEEAWLSGTDIFADILLDPVDVFAGSGAVKLYGRTFG